MKFLTTLLTGHTFWRMFSFINLLFVIVGLFTGVTDSLAIILMWLSLATAEILKAIEAKQPTP